MSTLAVTSITNFILASELFFLAGLMTRTPKVRLSAAWFWAGAMTALATSALLGGIDHGFVEPAGQSRYLIQRSNWIVMGIVTFCTLMTTARQFLPSRWQGPVLVLATIQLLVYALAVTRIDSFAIVIVDYAPVVLLLLALSIRGLRDGLGSWQMVTGIVVLLVATAVQSVKLDLPGPLDGDGLYHVIAMAGVPFMYWGGLRLRRA
jgi:hypothetical protein